MPHPCIAKPSIRAARQLPGFVELIELGGAFESVFNRFYRASIGWDGSEPVRSFI
jgi:hypothetical protein